MNKDKAKKGANAFLYYLWLENLLAAMIDSQRNKAKPTPKPRINGFTTPRNKHPSRQVWAKLKKPQTKFEKKTAEKQKRLNLPQKA